MCRAQNEGGQRCASHAKDVVTAAQSKYDRTGKPDDLQALVSAHVEYASTPEGHEKALKALADGDPAPGELPTEMWQRIADDGAALRERNQTIKEAIKAAAAKGDAFHADVVEKMGGSHWYVPAGVRGPKALAKFLDDQHERVHWGAYASVEDDQEAAALDAVLNEVANAPITPNATPDQRLPRTEEERAAWVARLTQGRDSALGMARDRRALIEEHNERMARFGRSGWPTDPAQVPVPLQANGALVRLRNDDGTLSEQEYLVTSGDREEIGVIPLQEIEPGVAENGRPAAVTFKARATSVTGDTRVTVDRLAPASDATIAKYGAGRLEIAENRYTVVDEGDDPNDYRKHQKVVHAWNPGQNAVASFDKWRTENAHKYQPSLFAAAANGPSLGERLKGMFSS